MISPMISNYQYENNLNHYTQAKFSNFTQAAAFQNNTTLLNDSNFSNAQGNQMFFNNTNLNSSFNDLPIKVRPELQMSYKHARRVYVGNMPDGVSESQIGDFIYKALEVAGGCIEAGNPVF